MGQIPNRLAVGVRKMWCQVAHVGIVLDGEAHRRATRAEISSVAKIHPTCSAIAHVACDGLITGWLTRHQIVGMSPAMNNIAQMKKTRSRLAQPNVFHRRKRTAKSGRTIRAVMISTTISHCNRARPNSSMCSLPQLGRSAPTEDTRSRPCLLQPSRSRSSAVSIRLKRQPGLRPELDARTTRRSAPRGISQVGRQ